MLTTPYNARMSPENTHMEVLILGMTHGFVILLTLWETA